MSNRTLVQQHEDSHTEWLAFRKQTMTPQLVAEMLQHSSARARLDALRSGMASQAQIQTLLKDSAQEIRAEALFNFRQRTPEQIAAALADESPVVRRAALSFEVTQAQAVTAFEDSQTRYEAIRTGKLPQVLLDRAMADSAPDVREAAAVAGGKRNLRGALKNIIYSIRCSLNF